MSQSLASMLDVQSYPTTIQCLTDEDIPQLTPLPGELWAMIPNTNSRYFVSNMGRVLTRIYRGAPKWALLKPFITGKGYKTGRGYPQVRLYLGDGTWVRPKVHRLVAQAFVSNPNGYPHVDHINNDPTDNRAENLQWVPNAENTRLRYARSGKLSWEKAEEIRKDFEQTELTKEGFCVAWGKKLGVCRGTIRFLLNDQTWQSDQRPITGTFL